MLVHECAPFDCFWKGRAALAITVVVQPFEINGGVRSFFLFKTAVNAGVQEKQNHQFSIFLLISNIKYLFFMGFKFLA
jgi:hypothetical protein